MDAAVRGRTVGPTGLRPAVQGSCRGAPAASRREGLKAAAGVRRAAHGGAGRRSAERDPADPGHLTNGAFSLPSPLEVSFSKASWTAPVSNDPVTIAFNQHIDASDALRTGTYSKTLLTLTLSTTTP
jgi:hypothetical protein